MMKPVPVFERKPLQWTQSVWTCVPTQSVGTSQTLFPFVRLLSQSRRVAGVFAAECAPDAVGTAVSGVGGGSDGGEVATVDVVANEAGAAIGHRDLHAARMFAGGRPDARKQVSGD